jgi:hypothetical protein
MQQISIFGILCEINLKNKKKLIFRLPKPQSPKVVVGLLLCRACQDEYDDMKIIEI